MTPETMLRRITDYANRADPYPLYAELRKTPVARQEDGTYVVSTYSEILSLLHDPRISSDLRNRTTGDANAALESTGLTPSFIQLDPPEHDRLRRLVMRHFGPPHAPKRIHAMRGEIARITRELISQFDGRDRIDIVDDFAYPLPVTVICSLLGVPREDEPQFHGWADAIVASIGPGHGEDPDRQRAGQDAKLEMGKYMAGLIDERRNQPGTDMISGLINDDGPEGQLSPAELIVNCVLLFIAGHETTVNLITNGMLTLLRNPGTLERLRDEPRLMPGAVEEVLRYEPPIQLLPQRTALTHVDVAGTTIAPGAPVTLVLASGNRDPQRFPEPDRFNPERQDNQHLGFGSGIHLCFGAPLARLEAQVALTELIRHLRNPALVTDPPPYRPNAVLRGPRHLLVECP